jgi:hypothetical protein
LAAVTIAAFSCSARKIAALLDRSGSKLRFSSDGAAWYQRSVAHDVGEDGEDAVRPGRHSPRSFFEDVVHVDAAFPRDPRLLLAEHVAEPPRGEPHHEHDRLGLPLPGNDVGVHADRHVGVGRRCVHVDELLPEGPAQDGALAGAYDAEAGTTELHVAATDDHERVRGQSRHGGRARRDAADHRAGLGDGREDVVPQADATAHLRGPAATGEREDPGRSRVGGVGDEFAAEPHQGPVPDHGQAAHALVELRPVALDPGEPRQGPQREGLPRGGVELRLQARVPRAELVDLGVRPGVDVGTRPQLPTGLVVQHDAFAHAGRAHGADLAGFDARIAQGLRDGPRQQRPVRLRVEVHRPGHARILAMVPLLLADGDLATFDVEDHRSAAARAGVDGE